MFDHAMCGGANIYRERAIEERVTAGHGCCFARTTCPPSTIASRSGASRTAGPRLSRVDVRAVRPADRRGSHRGNRAEQPGLVRRAACVRRVAHGGTQRPSGGAPDGGRSRLLRGVSIVSAARRRRTLLRHPGMSAVRVAHRAAQRELRVNASVEICLTFRRNRRSKFDPPEPFVFEPVALATNLHDMRVVQEAITLGPIAAIRAA